MRRRAGAERTEPRDVAIETLIRAIPDFPVPGILFRDITPLLKDAAGFRAAIDLFVARYEGQRIAHVVAIEALGGRSVLQGYDVTTFVRY